MAGILFTARAVLEPSFTFLQQTNRKGAMRSCMFAVVVVVATTNVYTTAVATRVHSRMRGKIKIISQFEIKASEKKVARLTIEDML